MTRPVDNRVAVVGNVSLDTIVSRNGITTTTGGAALNFAVGCRVVGITPRLVSIVGTDLGADEIDKLARYFDTRNLLVRRGSSCRFRLDYCQSDVPRVRCRYGVSKSLSSYVSGQRIRAAHVHMSCRRPIDSAGLLRLRPWSARAVISLDFIHSSINEQLRMVEPFLELTSYVFVNRSEWPLLKAALRDRKSHALVLVTSGPRGAKALQDGRVVARVSAAKTMVVDQSGAGDVFAGAFIGCRVRGMGVAEAMTVAARIAGRSLLDFGSAHLLRTDVDLGASTEA